MQDGNNTNIKRGVDNDKGSHSAAHSHVNDYKLRRYIITCHQRRDKSIGGLYVHIQGYE